MFTLRPIEDYPISLTLYQPEDTDDMDDATVVFLHVSSSA